MEIQLTGQRLWSREHIEKVTRQMFGTLERNRNARIEKLIEWTDAGSMSLPAVGAKKRNAALFESRMTTHAAVIDVLEPVVTTDRHVDSEWTWPEGMTAGDIMASATPMVDAMPLRKGDVVAMVINGRVCIGDLINDSFVQFRGEPVSGWYGTNVTMERLPQARLVYRRETVESAPCAPEEGPDILSHSDGVDPLGRAIERPAVDAPRFGYGGELVAMGWAAYED